MRIRFWGTRGAFAAPGAAFHRYGGSTICTEVVADDGTRVVVDLGSGAIALGHALLAEAAASGGSRRLAVVLSHTQIDHIQGMPFFAPAILPGWDVHLLGPSYAGRDISGILDGALNPNYSPLYSVENLSPKVELVTLTEGDLAWDSIRIRTRELPHEGARSLGFRIEADGATLAMISDVTYAGEPTAAALDLASDADVLVHDAMQPLVIGTKDKHLAANATPADAVAVAREAEARRLYLYHHDPDATDEQLDQLMARVRRVNPGMFIDGAREGEWVEVRSAG